MFFTIKSKIANRSFMKLKVLSDAKKIILNHTLKVDEVQLNEFLKKEYNLTLTLACMHLLNHCKVQQDRDNNIIILFESKKLDTLASLITYGNLEVRGSKILKEAFLQTVD